MFTIREIQTKDYIGLQNIYETSIKNNVEGFIQTLDIMPKITDFIENSRKSGGEFFGLFENDKIIGMGGLVQTQKNQYELCKLHLDSNYKGQKLGQKLVEYIINYAKEEGAEIVSLHVTKSQIPAINLYKKLNFIKSKEDIYTINIKGKDFSYDTLYMYKKLQ